GLPWILAEPDADPLAVLAGGVEQQSLHVPWVRTRAHHVKEPIAAILVTAELDADGPVRVVESQSESSAREGIELDVSAFAGRLARLKASESESEFATDSPLE